MALFRSSFNPPSVRPRPKISWSSAIQRPLRLKTETSFFEIPKFSISAPTKTLNNKVKYCSNLNSHVELEQEPPTSVIIFVKAYRWQYAGLAQSTGEGGLKEAFSRFGEVSRVKVVLDKKTKQSLGFAYVWFTREEHAGTAVEEMNGQFLEGRFIHVVLSKPGSCKTRPEPSPYKF